MAEDLFLLAALLCAVIGMGWLALAMDAHWRQVRGQQRLEPGPRRALRGLGGVALVAALALCLLADHASMAALVWVMSLTASALLVAFTLAWRPHWLSWLVAWLPRDGTSS